MNRQFNYFIGLNLLFFFFTFTSPAQAQKPSINDSLHQKYVQALYLAGEKKYDNAVQLLKEVIDLDSSYFKAYRKIFEISTYKNTIKETALYFENLVAADSKNLYALHGLGLIYTARKEYQKAYDTFAKAIRMNMDYFSIYPDFVDVNYDVNEAKKNFEMIIEAYPKNAAAHFGLAYYYSLQENYDQQFVEAQKAAELNPTIVYAYFHMSEAKYRKGDYDEALKICDQGLKIAGENLDVENEIELLKLKALIINKLGKTEKALTILQQTLEKAVKTGDKNRENRTLSDLSRIYWFISQYEEALNYSTRALKIAEQLDNKYNQASDLNYMGIFSAEMGNYSKALEYFTRARDLFLQESKQGRAAVCMGNLAGVYVKLGNEMKAIPLIEESIRLFRELKTGWQKSEATYIGLMGDIFFNTGELNKASDYYNQAVDIYKQLKTEAHQVSYFLSKIGDVHRDQGDYSLASDYYKQALNISENAKIFKEITKAANLINIGYLCFLQREFKKAESYLIKALKIGDDSQVVDIIWSANAGLALIYQKQSRFKEALTSYENAVNTIETVSEKLKSAEYKTGFLQDKIEIYTDLVGLLFTLHQRNPNNGYDVMAFQYAEKAKARTLLDMIYQGRILNNIADIPTDFKQKYFINEREIEKVENKLSEELSKSDEDKNEEIIVTLTEKKQILVRQRISLIDEIKNKYPKFHELSNPKIISAGDFQRSVLKDQVLVEYLVGKENVFVWILSKDKKLFRKIELTRQELENKLAAISPFFQKKKQLNGVQIDHHWANFKIDLLHDLYQQLLGFIPKEIIMPGTDLIIVPDDILFYFPFEILVSRFNRDEIYYLIEEHPVSYASSASLLNPQLKKTKVASKNLLAFGNPEFSEKPSLGIIDWVRALLPSNSMLRVDNFAQLPFAEVEVKSIGENFSNSTILTGRNATEKQLKENAGDYKYIHFATHNITEDKQPMYSKIILAQNKNHNEDEDGFLQTFEVYNLRLNADLVVLSGCNTGLGRLYKGEGLVGMTRAFLYAGTPSIVVSLWPVQDESTASLMKEFYKNLKNGMPKNRALQQAKVMLIKSQDWKRDPFYWGAFVLIGDWSKVK